MSLKQTAKNAIATGWDTFGRLNTTPKLTIIYYHAVTADAAEAFDAQMAYLRRTANIVPADHQGLLDPARPNVAVTFDDAFRSVRENALAALQRHRIPATIFVPTGWLGRRPGWQMETTGDAAEVVMTGEELAALPRDVVSFGSHTVDHPHLTKLAEAALDDQVRRSREVLETLLGAPIDTLAFPYGDHNDRVVERAQAAGYRQVYTVQPQPIRAGDRSIKRGRTSADPRDPPRIFAMKTRGAFDWMPMASRLKSALKGRS
ncbi:polysaccharide deacetylase family protein [uncultured Phenylobacterium sp.]|uniref:polysaccharide deacetylase family protein n=1 Tax=uncultured Phenylobacterium sp. TaxID=349273 RepID=UPI0025D6EE9E|nr:polysaccharide deacetylase family protein [uncultured Phenylobacterium sp.]